MEAVEGAGVRTSAGRSSASNTSRTVRSLCTGWAAVLAQARQRSSSQAFSSASVPKRGTGVKKRPRAVRTWFSTWPFSQAARGVQAVGSTKWCEQNCWKRRLKVRCRPAKIAATAVRMLS